MVSERLRAILHAKGATFSADELAAMSDADGWRWLYQKFPPKPKDTRSQVCFTGHTAAEKERLKGLAAAAGWRVVTSITMHLSVLCTGEMPGPSKLKTARARNDIQVLTTEDFVARLENQTGEKGRGSACSS